MDFRWGIGHNGTLAILSGIIEDYNRRHRGESEVRYEIFDEHVTTAMTPARILVWRTQARRPTSPLRILRTFLSRMFRRVTSIVFLVRAKSASTRRAGAHTSAHFAPSRMHSDAPYAREPEELAQWIAKTHDRYKVQVFGFTDDNFPRNPRHLEVLEAIARIREEGARTFKVSLMADVETTCYGEEDSKRGAKTRQFLDSCKRAGVGKVCIGLESTSDAALREMKKHVNRARAVAANEVRFEPKHCPSHHSRGWRHRCPFSRFS